jgi:response regulator RpfG family c-di-GMP phosphodiesterase
MNTSAHEKMPRPGRILLVDDEPSILASLRRLLKSHGFEVFLANSGQEGLEVLEREPIDIVFSDMRMPGMDGSQFLEQVFARWPETKRILLTGYADVKSTIAAVNQGKIWRYIAKPWDDGDLLLCVEQALGHRRLLNENARLLKLTQDQNEELKSLNASLETRVNERTGELQRALKALHQSFINTVNVFSSLMDMRGGLLAGHARRVAENARKVAKRMGMSDGEVQEIFLAGLLHDIGKLGLPDEATERPFNALGPELRAELMKHSVKGEMLLMSVPQLARVAQLVRHHHELFDGEGYPDSLSGMMIPMGARILTVVNDFDSLQIGTLAARPLRPPEALRFMVDNRGKRYDPTVVDAFEEVLVESSPADEFIEMLLRPSSLHAGQRLTRDLMHEDGYLLLARDHILTAAEIAQLARLEASEKHPITLYVTNAG